MGEDRLTIVLVEPRNAGNVGLVARTMVNFGLSRLVLAGPTELPAEKDYLAGRVEGRPVLETHGRAHDLAHALAGMEITIAVTRRTGKHRPGDLTPATLPPFLDSAPPDAQVALVFGREANGLLAEEVLLCNRLLRIPTAEAAPSLNLAQAVAVVTSRLFEYQSAAGRDPSPPPRFPQPDDGEPLARTEELERLQREMALALGPTGFLQGDRVADTLAWLRRLMGRAGLSTTDARRLRGLARRIRLASRTGPGR